MNIERVRNAKSDYVFDFVVYASLIFAFLAVAYPLYFVCIASISNPDLVNTGRITVIPRGVNFDGYKMIFENPSIWRGYRNSLVYAAGYAGISVTMSLLTGYALSKKRLFGRRMINLFFVITMYFTGGLIPLYLTVRDLNLINNPVIMWIMNSLVVFHVILARTFFETTIPDELEDAARVDGCNQARFFGSVVLPLSKPIVAVLALYAIVYQWNQYFNALIFLNDSEYYPLQMVLRKILIVNQSMSVETIGNMKMADERRRIAELLKFGLIVVASVPLLIIYPFIQKYFVKGVMIGSIKG